MSSRECLPRLQGEPDILLRQAYGQRYPDQGALPFDLHFSPSDEQNVRLLTREGQSRMDVRYGTGYPDFQFNPLLGECHFGYNTGYHGRTFGQNAQLLGERLNRTPEELLVYDLMGRWHDIVQDTIVRRLPREGSDEQASIEWLIRRIRQKGLPIKVAELAAYGIASTRVVMDTDNKMLGQWGNLQDDYPSEELFVCSRIGPAADLSDLFTPIGLYVSHKLYAQRHGYTPWDTVPFDDAARAFLLVQLGFLSEYEYHLPEAEALFTSLRGPVIKQAEKLEYAAGIGCIRSWDEVFAYDEEFIKKYC